MRHALILAALLLPAACSQRPQAVSTQYGAYTPPYPDLLRSAPPKSTPPARPPDPWNNETERDYIVHIFGAAEALGCKLVSRDQTVNLMMRIDTAPRFRAVMTDARRKELRTLGINAGLNSAPAGCDASTGQLLAILRSRYGTAGVSAPAPAKSGAPTSAELSGDHKTSPTDTGWQRGADAPRPLPPINTKPRGG